MMSDDDPTSLMDVVKAFLVPLIVAVVVGAGASFVTIQVTTATLEEKVEAHAIQIAKIEDQQSRMAEIQRKNDRDLVDRLARIETQIKLLLKHERNR